MTEYLNTVQNPAAPWPFIEDTEENILHDLECHALDPLFEMYGDFINRSPEWLNEKNAEKYAGCCMISGNFLSYTHAFRLVTDDAALIAHISDAVQRNKSRPEYQKAHQEMIDRLPILTLENASIGHCYRFCNGWFRLTKIIHLTEQECNRDSLFYMDHYEGIDWNGRKQGGAFQDGRRMSTTKNWEIYKQCESEQLMRPEKDGKPVIYLEDHRPGVHLYTPELGERKPETKMTASFSHDGRHYYVHTPIELKGRGIKEGWEDGDGLHVYQVTVKAFDKLEKQYPISMRMFLD